MYLLYYIYITYLYVLLSLLLLYVYIYVIYIYACGFGSCLGSDCLMPHYCDMQRPVDSGQRVCRNSVSRTGLVKRCQTTDRV